MELFEVILTVDDDVERERQRLLGLGVELGGIRSPAEGVLVVDGRDPERNPFHLEQRK